MADKDAITRYKTAKRALHDNQRAEQAAGITHETDEYLHLNNEVNEAAKDVPRWRR